MKLIISAGGTSEHIDDVRSITNTSTGSLGHAIGQAFLKAYGPRIDALYYLHGLRAIPPEGEQVRAIAVEGVRDLEARMEELLSTEAIDAVVHAMAVSDYMVKEVTTLSALQSGAGGKLEGNKISSDVDDLVILMQRSPKVIGMIKTLRPAAVLVGFKLLSQAPRQELIEAGYNLLKKNRCTFVLANDLAEISGQAHRGYLIHQDGSYDTMETNAEIAAMIAGRVWEECQ